MIRDRKHFAHNTTQQLVTSIWRFQTKKIVFELYNIV